MPKCPFCGRYGTVELDPENGYYYCTYCVEYLWKADESLP
jgi:TFIIB zinc-binding